MKLKPCPFCKSSNLVVKGTMGDHWVHCSNCTGSSIMTASKEEAVYSWNRRKSDKKNTWAG